MEHEGLYLVRTTLNLAGLRSGDHALVDVDDPYMRDALATGALVLADHAPDDWDCVACGGRDGRTTSGGLRCGDCEAAVRAKLSRPVFPQNPQDS